MYVLRIDTQNQKVVGEPLSADLILYYLAFALYFSMTFFERTTFEKILFLDLEDYGVICNILVIFLLMMKILLQKSRPTQWLLAVVVVAVGFISWRLSRSGWLFWMALFIVCGEGIEIKKLSAIAFFLASLLLIIAATFAVLGLIDNYSMMRPETHALRYGMGLSHPNYFGLFLLVICTSFSVMRFGKNPFPSIVLLALTTLLNMMLSDSRTAAVLSAGQALLLILFYFIKSPSARKAMTMVFVAGIIATMVLSILMMIFYDDGNPLHLFLDKITNLRFSRAHAYYQLAPLSLLGRDYEPFGLVFGVEESANYFFVDNGYACLILRFGLIPACLFVAGYAFLIRRIVVDRLWDELLFGLVLMSIYSVTETLGLRFECNYFLVSMASMVLYSKREVTALPTKNDKTGTVF